MCRPPKLIAATHCNRISQNPAILLKNKARQSKSKMRFPYNRWIKITEYQERQGRSGRLLKKWISQRRFRKKENTQLYKTLYQSMNITLWFVLISRGKIIFTKYKSKLCFYGCSEIVRTRNFKIFTVYATIFRQFMAAFHFF